MRTKELARAHSDIAQELEDYATIIDKEHLPAARDALNDGVAFGGLHIVGQQVDPIPVVGNNGPIMIPNPAGVAIADVGAAGLIANWARSYWAVSRALFYAVDGGSGWADEARRIEQNCEGRKEYCHKQYSTPEMIITYSVRGQDWDGKEKSFEFTALTVGTDCSCNVNCFVPTGPYDRPRRRP